jgi:hypothetical protein
MLDNQIQTKDDLKQRMLRGIIVAFCIAISLITSYSAYYFVNAWTSNCPTVCTYNGQKRSFYQGGPCWYVCDLEQE